MNKPNQHSAEVVEKLFNQFAERLYAFATKAWKFSEDDAWETIYETLFHIAKVYYRYDFPDEKRLANFVITVFNNRLKNRRRNKQSEPVHIQFQDSEGLTETPEAEINLSVAEKAVSEALDELEDWERILLIQRSALVPYSEIEKLVSKSEQQLKVYFKRALMKLETSVKQKLSMERSNEKRN
jgi:RNA polymerase sigma factor (sigma-70 family)